MKRSSLTWLSGAIFAAGVAPAHALTITWHDNFGAYFDYSADPNQNGFFAPGMEMRAFDASTGQASAEWTSSLTGADGGPVVWTFDEVTGELTGVSGADATPGGSRGPAGPSADPGGPGLFESGTANGSPFGFLAPTRGSAAGDTYGAATLEWSSFGSAFTVHVPVLEHQWAGFFSRLGLDSSSMFDHGPGVDFDCTIFVVPSLGSGGYIGDAICMAEEYLSPSGESLNLDGLTMQWQLIGSVVVAPVPVPATVWLLGSGLIGLFGLTRRRVPA